MSEENPNAATDEAVRRAHANTRNEWVEWPTLTLLVLHWIAWVIATLSYSHSPSISIAALIIIVALNSSLLHEILHDHPFKSRRLNDACGMISLSLWLPYRLYKSSHLQHHVNRHLTDPDLDPESNYVSAERYAHTPAWLRWIQECQRSLMGRLLIGSWWRIGMFFYKNLLEILKGDRPRLWIWFEHGLVVALLVWFLNAIAHLPIWVYALCVVVPANGLLLIRSFAEHKALEPVKERTAIVEHAHILGALYLNNNLHALHHDEPQIPWYRYKEHYALRREELIAANGGLWYKNYWELFRRFAFTPQDAWIDPLTRPKR